MKVDEMNRMPGSSEGYTSVDLMKHLRVLWMGKWKIAAVALVAGVASLGYTFVLPDVYRSTAVIKPDLSDKDKGGAAFGALASFGVVVGGPSKVEDLEVLLKSEDLTIRVFRKYNLWSAVFGERYDSGTGKLKAGILDRLQGDMNPAKSPGDWDAIRAVKDLIAVRSDKRTGTLTISFESTRPASAAEIVRYYLEEAKSRLQEEALSRANKNKEFIQAQIAKTLDPLTRDRLYSLYGQEVEREMLAKNRDQFGFTVIDAPKVPDRKIRPKRVRTAITFFFLGFCFACAYYLLRRNTEQ